MSKSLAWMALLGLAVSTAAAAPVAVRPQDIVYRFSAADADSYRRATLQCQGTNKYFTAGKGGGGGRQEKSLSGGLMGTDDQGQSFAAFSVVPSPGEPGKSAFQWQVRPTDPDTAGSGAKRCEFSAGWKDLAPERSVVRLAGLQANQVNWWAVAVRTDDWAASGEANDWQVLWQWHDAYGGGLPPFLNLSAKGNHWYLQLVYDPNPTPKDATLKRVALWDAPHVPNTWARFVVKSRKDMQSPSSSFVQIWLDGRQVVDYHGLFGYAVPQVDYAKVGIYHWISTANKWHPDVPLRRTWTKGPVQVNDNTGYTWESIDALLD